MRARRLLVLLATAGAVLALALSAPLSVLLSSSPLVDSALVADEVTGTPWSGTLRHARWRGVPLGDVSVSVRPLAWLVGVQHVELANDTLSIGLLAGNRHGFERGDGSLSIARVPALSGAAIQIRLADATLVFDDRRCLRAGGSVQVQLTLADAGLPPLSMTGPVACGSTAGQVRLGQDASSAASAAVRFESTVNIDPDGRYRVESVAASDDPDTLSALRLAGFQPGPTGLSRIDEGAIWSVSGEK